MRNISLASMEKNPYLDKIIQVTSGKNMITDGPLSLQYAKALNEIYKKETDPATGISLETQANDEIVSKSYWTATASVRAQLSENDQDVGLLYGVNQDEVGMLDVINVSDAIGQMTYDEKLNSAIVIDAKYIENNTGDVPVVTKTIVNPYIDQIQAIADENGIPIYSSLEDFVKKTRLLDGKWPGTMSGNKVKFSIDGKVHKFTNDTGVKSKNVPCIVVVKNHDVYEINIT